MSARAPLPADTNLSLAVYLARRELRRRYAGSAFGALWSIALPLLTIALYWVVFGLGLKISSGTGAAFAPLLIAGILPWFALNDALAGMTGSVTGNTPLVKRIVLPLELLPISSLMAAMAAHLAIVTVAILVLWRLGEPPGAHLLGLFYFTACLIVFALAAGTLLALANVAFRDAAHLLAPLMILWFWATPIVWPASLVPDHLQWILSANPLHYLTQGYRWALLGPQAAQPGASATIWFWAETLALGALSWAAFRTFKRQVADLL